MPLPTPQKTETNSHNLLHKKIANNSAPIAIVGLGYVGLPLARAVHEAGYPVIGFDLDKTKIDLLERGESYLHHLGSDLTQTLAASNRFTPTADAARLTEADIILLCVPTPLGEGRTPDLSFVLESTRLVARILRPGQLIILESTTYPGTTRDEMQPLLDESGLTCGTDYFLAYSPEREDPGRQNTSTKTIPKLVGGVDSLSGDLAQSFYEKVIDEVHRVESAEVAEAAKLLENIYRAVNIAMVNELKLVFEPMGIDIWAVIKAAATKPFGFSPFYPGPGLGGHCIPIDPFYLAWKAKEIGHKTQFIELAGEINRSMPHHVVDRLVKALNDESKSLKKSNILILGIAYKPDIDDIRESPAAEIIELLTQQGATVAYHDPLVPVFPKMRQHTIELSSVSLTAESLPTYDATIIVTDHTAIDYPLLGRSCPLIIDTRNAMAHIPGITAKIVKA